MSSTEEGAGGTPSLPTNHMMEFGALIDSGDSTEIESKTRILYLKLRRANRIELDYGRESAMTALTRFQSAIFAAVLFLVIAAPVFSRPQTTLVYPFFYANVDFTTDIWLWNRGAGSSAGFLALYNVDGSLITGEGITNPRSFSIPAGGSLAIGPSYFGNSLSTLSPFGWVRATGSGSLAGSFLVSDSGGFSWFGGKATSLRPTSLLFTEALDQLLNVVNPNPVEASGQFDLVGPDGSIRASALEMIPANGKLTAPASNLFIPVTINAGDYVRATSARGLVGYQFHQDGIADTAGLNAQDRGTGATSLNSILYSIGPDQTSSLSVVNLDSTPGQVTFRFYETSGSQAGSTQTLDIPASGKLHVTDQSFFLDPSSTRTGHVTVDSNGPRLAGSSIGVWYDEQPPFAVPLNYTLETTTDYHLSSNASDLGYMLINPNPTNITVQFTCYDAGGAFLGSSSVLLAPEEQTNSLVSMLLDSMNLSPYDGIMRISSAHTFYSSILIADPDWTLWATLPPSDSVQATETRTDFDLDGMADIAVWRPDSGVWFTVPSNSPPGSYTQTQWGLPSDKPVSADYDGDARTDIAVWRPDSGVWYTLQSNSPGTYTAVQWGVSTDIPVPGDYDGDCRDDIAVWRPETGIWYVLPSGSTPGTYTATQWGVSSDTPVPADYDGDGATDIAVIRNGIWYVLPSSKPLNYTVTQWGLSTDIPVPGDFDSDGKTDVAVWRPDTGAWYALPSSDPSNYTVTQWGLFTDIPVPGDFDSDGKTDVAVWRPDTGVWYILPSSLPAGSYTTTQWGMNGDRPISGATSIHGVP
jgi:hypothetical protein